MVWMLCKTLDNRKWRIIWSGAGACRSLQASPIHRHRVNSSRVSFEVDRRVGLSASHFASVPKSPLELWRRRLVLFGTLQSASFLLGPLNYLLNYPEQWNQCTCTAAPDRNTRCACSSPFSSWSGTTKSTFLIRSLPHSPFTYVMRYITVTYSQHCRVRQLTTVFWLTTFPNGLFPVIKNDKSKSTYPPPPFPSSHDLDFSFLMFQFLVFLFPFFLNLSDVSKYYQKSPH